MPKKKNSRAAHGSGTIRQRADGRWEARVTVGRDPGTGKHIRKSIYGASEKEVARKLRQATAAVDAGTYTEPSKLTMAQWLDIWAAEYLGNLKPNTLYYYKGVCNHYLKPALGAVKMVVLSAHTIQTLYNKLQAGTDEKQGLSAKTIKNINGVLHKAMQQAIELDYIRHNPCHACKLPRAEKPEIKPLDDEQISSFLKAIQGHQWEALFLVTMFTGMRQGEALGLSWLSVDFERGSISVGQQLQKDRATGKYAIVATKNSKSRRITPAPFVMDVLREQRRRQTEWRLRAGPAWEGSDLVFTNELGHHLAPKTVYSHYKRIADSIGIPESRFHDLRHTYAVAALQSGDDVKTVQENLGHHTASFTLDVYGHVTDKMKKDSADRMEKYIKRIK